MAEANGPLVDLRKYCAELIGTFFLVFMGCGSVVMSNIILGHWWTSPDQVFSVGALGIAFAFGVTVMIMVYAIGPISGCHINPAITISMLTAGKIAVKDAVAYIVAQFVGAIAGAEVLLTIASGSPYYSLSGDGLGANGYGSHSLGMFSLPAVFAAEIVLTFLFLIVIFGATSERAPKGFAGIAIGMSLFVIHIVGIPIDGTSVNPARSFGPALLLGGTALDQVWVFLVAPVIGGILAAIVWKFVLDAGPAA